MPMSRKIFELKCRLLRMQQTHAVLVHRTKELVRILKGDKLFTQLDAASISQIMRVQQALHDYEKVGR